MIIAMNPYTLQVYFTTGRITGRKAVHARGMVAFRLKSTVLTIFEPPTISYPVKLKGIFFAMFMPSD